MCLRFEAFMQFSFLNAAFNLGNASVRLLSAVCFKTFYYIRAYLSLKTFFALSLCVNKFNKPVAAASRPEHFVNIAA